jgi:HK97 family phage major capsid protein
MNEQVGSEGGFALQEDFAGAIFESAVQTGDILNRVDSYPIGSNSNSAKWLEIEETDVSTSVFGGVQVYWAAEAQAVTATKPKLVERKLELEKLFGLAYATSEMLEDTSFVSALFNRAFSLAINRKLEIDTINGNGVGCPLGVLNSDCLVEVSKEVGQGAGTVVYPNIVKAWNRMLPLHRSQAVWLTHPDTEEQLEFMQFPVGTGGVPVFLPPSGATQSPYAMLKGRPIIPTDACAALGDPGDILLADLSQYMMIVKGGMRQDTSIHVQFTTDQQAFRFIYRANGKPKLAGPVTLRNSSVERSAFVALAARK